MTEEFVEIRRDATVWRFEREFLESNWVCTFGAGCQGILEEPAPELNQGCCSLGADLGDGPDGEHEAMAIAAYAAVLGSERWQFHAIAHAGPDGVPAVFRDQTRSHTRVVDDACIFLNRPGFAGGEGCALHLAADDFGESPTEWKPSVCWQLPLRVDWDEIDEQTESATVRRWTRSDWGAQGERMAWCCTERSDGGEAYRGSERVVDSLAESLTALTGEAVVVELRQRLNDAT